MGDFGATCEAVLLKYRKHVIRKCLYRLQHLIYHSTDEQYVLTRLADAIIDIYCMAAVVAR